MIGLLVFRLEMLTAVIAAITVFYSVSLILSASMAIRTFQNSPEERISDAIVYALKDANWPLYTILCPLYREAQVVPQFVQAMLALDYPPQKLQILFLTEEDDSETRNAIRALSLPPHFKILVVPDGKPRTKPRACNYGLMQATGSYVVIYDAEDIPDPLQLKKAVLAFANHETDVVCVQAKLNFYNIRQNLLTRWFTAEYSAWFDADSTRAAAREVLSPSWRHIESFSCSGAACLRGLGCLQRDRGLRPGLAAETLPHEYRDPRLDDA